MLDIKKAAAGSGKTFLLTQEYLKLLLGFINTNRIPQIYYSRLTAKARLEAHKKILAITFTNKATEEMKHRIVNELYILSSGGESQHMETLCRYYKVGQETIQKAAQKALSELLFDFSRFNISTIDSFFQNILRTFAREANIGAEYGVELREDSIIKGSTTDLIHSLHKNKDSKLHGWLKQYIISKIDRKRSWNIFSENAQNTRNGESLYSIAQEIGKEDFKTHKKEFIEFLKQENSLSNFKKALDTKIQECRKRKISNGLNFYSKITSSIDSKSINNKGAVIHFINKIANAQGSYNDLDLSLSDSFYDKYSETAAWFKKGVSVEQKVCSELLEYIKTIIETDRYERTYDIMGKNLYAIGLLGDISNNIQSYREENDIILISDTNEYLKKIIGTDDTPFIYERVGLSLKHFLIDEFQDTSKLQMANLSPLIHESLSHGHYNLIIGDEKQSIYRFRNADPNLLQNQIYIDFHDSLSEESKSVQKSTNWRSEENIIKFNNTFFCNLIEIVSKEFKSDYIKETYSNVVQNVPSKRIEGKGYINIKFLDNSENDNIDDNHKEWEESALNETISLIHDIIDRGYKQSDIAILVNTNSEGAYIIDAILKDNETNSRENKLSVISDDSLLLVNSPSINLIINIISYLDCSNIDIATESKEQKKQKDILKILQTYHKLIAQNKMSPSDALKTSIENNSEIISDDKLNDMVSQVTLKSSSLYSVTESIINNFISHECLENEAPYIYAFQDIVLEYCSHNTPSIHSFLKWWKANSNTFSITSPASNNAIKVMTIHKSKGLEFQCVIIPFADWNISSFNDMLWLKTPQIIKEQLNCSTPPIIPIRYNKHLSLTFFCDQLKKIITDMIIDNLNKTYVVMTRAASEMYIFAPKENSKPEKFSSYLKASLIKNVRDSGDFINLGKGMIDENHFVYGEPANHKQKEETTDGPDNNIVHEYNPGKSLGNFAFKIPDIENKYKTTDMGNLYHNIMSFIQYHEDLNFALNKSVSKHLIKKEEKENFSNTISKWLDNPIAKNWFDKKYQIMTERTMLISDKEYRADRIVIDNVNNSATVIDYKFGKNHLPKYKEQVSNYMKILKESGYNEVKGYIWYPFDGTIDEA